MARFDLGSLRVPIVQAPLAGGPSTVALSAAVARAGGLGFLAAGYRTASAVRDDIRAFRAALDVPFGVNLFAAPREEPDMQRLRDYAATLDAETRRHEVALGEPLVDDDAWEQKLDVVDEERVPVVSFTFGCPSADVVERLHRHGTAVWVTVTGVDEAVQARDVGADALVAQGAEAGGHRASFGPTQGGDAITLLALLQLLREAVNLPLVAAGGIATGAAIAAVLCAGAAAAQLGTALMRTPEAGTSAVHRAALARPTPTRLTRAFTGKPARAIVNRFVEEHSDGAPSAYPALHHMTAPLRAAGRERGDADVVNLWAGQAHTLAADLPAEELIRRLMAGAREAIEAAHLRIGG